MKHDQFPRSKKVIAAAGVALALAACSASPSHESAPTEKSVITVSKPSLETTTTNAATPNPESLVGKDKDEYAQTLIAVTEARAGYPDLALSHADKVDDEGSFTRVQARDMVEPAVAQFAVNEARAGYPDLALSHADKIDEEGAYTKSQAIAEVNTAIKNADHP